MNYMWIYLLEKEFKQFFRDPGLPKMAVAFPILMMLVFPFAVSMEIRNINLVIVDNDRSEESQELIEKCTASGYFRLIDICEDPEHATELMDMNTADAILTIRQDFSKDLKNGSGSPLGIKVNTVNGTKGSMGAQYLGSCIRDYISEYNDTGISMPAENLTISEKYYYNPYMDYKVFMVPALIVIAITMVTGFFPALNIVGEKETGTIEQINVSPVKKSAFIICKLIPYWAVAFFILMACMTIAWLVFGYSSSGGYWTLALFTALQITVTAGLGLLISSHSDNAQQAMFIIWFFMMIFMLMSGIFTPIASMPDWAKAITLVNPLRYYADAMRAVFLKGSTIADVWYDAVSLFAIGITILTWAVFSYRKTSK